MTIERLAAYAAPVLWVSPDEPQSGMGLPTADERAYTSPIWYTP